MRSSIPSSFFFIFIVFPLIQFLSFVKALEPRHDECKRTIQCGNLIISYPFYDDQIRPAYCGYPGYRVKCSYNHTIAEISVSTSSSEVYYLLSTSTNSNTITVAREDYLDTLCPGNLSNTSLNVSLYNYTSSDEFVTLHYECSEGVQTLGNQFSCRNMNNSNAYFMTRAMESNLGSVVPPWECHRNVSVPVNRSIAARLTDRSSLQAAFRRGFELEWIGDNGYCVICRDSGGVCGYNTSAGRFACFCANEIHDSRCDGSGHLLTKSPIMVILASTAGAGIIIFVLILCSKGRLPRASSKKWQDVEVVLKIHGSPGPKRYTYSDLKRITSYFKDKIGEGGYGIVYKGKLHDGHEVAVKILKKSSQGDVKEFINEVVSIGNTNHINIVKLLGFCFEGKKRALVYNYMPNGSLEKFTYGGTINHQLHSWEKLFEIVVGIARGLEYLHRGCETRILHFDIKPQNILLDENFCPKISDFGLARSCPQKESIISMSEARGTIGYIAPEVFFKSMGGVSHKSDVYSYGMLVLEMVGCRNNADVGAECSSEQYFPNWIYKQLEQVEEVCDHQEGISNRNGQLRRKMVLVSLWCIQTSPMNRPNMTRVVEMLEGTLESLQIPPMPSLGPPLKSYQSFSTISVGGLFQE